MTGSPCPFCKHLKTPVDPVTPTCTAFPRGIPEKILLGLSDHQSPEPGDRGIRFDPATGFEYMLKKARF